ncbi:hypothetical protein [uncultured Corynebacterium sp.]|uniref:hypothetical protein n=1 Tax=uncultured Corynebacterium sp. TaxID=159447 RepID=UPI0025F2B710|nr:hypothetical protein [uncultured Corynebacterium sp.]
MSLPAELHMENLYADDYVPVSFEAPHSSLLRTATWVGMGFILTSLAFLGALVFGVANLVNGVQENAKTLTIGAAILAAFFMFGGFFLVHVGRKNYREYVKRSGRIH